MAEARQAWQAQAQEALDDEIDADLLNEMRGRAKRALENLREQLGEGVEDIDLDLPPPDLPEADPPENGPKPLVSSDMGLVEAIETLGVIDLRTGRLGPHDPHAYMTQLARVTPSRVDDCPRFMQFLLEITGGDLELVSFLQRMFGYCLTGSTQEHALFFLHGSGANGKSVLLNTVAGILGNYHRTAAVETFTASSSDRHPTELAWLQGRRLVTAIETEEGRRWAETKIKSLTGGDIVSARFMYQNLFEFVPQFKLVIAGSHKPGLRSVDEAIRRRFHLVPFNVTIPPEKRDPDLTETLKSEWPGILGWMLKGCLAWQREGLNPPAAVREATSAYLESQDTITAWFMESCERDPDGWDTRNDLWHSWTKWATAAGETVGTRTNFLDVLEGRLGLEPAKRQGVRGFREITITRPSYENAHWNR